MITQKNTVGAPDTPIIRREVPRSNVIIVSQNDPERRQVSEIGPEDMFQKVTPAQDLIPNKLEELRDDHASAQKPRQMPASGSIQ